MTSWHDRRSVCVVDGSRRDWLIDLGLCFAIAAYGLPPMLDPDVNNPAATTVGPLLLPVLLLPIPLRRRHPLGAAAVFTVACVVSGIPTFAQFRLVAAVPVAILLVYALATRSERTHALVGLASVLGGLVFIGTTESVIHGVGGAAQMAAFALPLCLTVWGAGRIVASRERMARLLGERSEQLRRQREATAVLAVEIDRERLASDLDLAVRSRLQETIELASVDGSDPVAGRARFARVERLGRESLDQMRELLGLLRAVDQGARAPRPSLEELDGLLADARAGGRVVDLEVEGERRPLTAGVELAAYRTLQHALAAIGSGRDQPTSVRLRYLPDRLELEVRGRQRGGTTAGAALSAARERVLVLGGSFTADTPSPGRRVVRAWLPAVPLHA
jgi:signal transduction histidine kinase